MNKLKNEIHEQTNAGHIFNQAEFGDLSDPTELIVRVICAGKGT